jgi:hypothetical protein
MDIQMVADPGIERAVNTAVRRLIEPEELVIQFVTLVFGLRRAETVGMLRRVQIPPVPVQVVPIVSGKDVRRQGDQNLLLCGVDRADAQRGERGRLRRAEAGGDVAADPERQAGCRIDADNGKQRQFQLFRRRLRLAGLSLAPEDGVENIALRDGRFGGGRCRGRLWRRRGGRLPGLLLRR